MCTFVSYVNSLTVNCNYVYKKMVFDYILKYSMYLSITIWKLNDNQYLIFILADAELKRESGFTRYYTISGTSPVFTNEKTY